MCAPQPASECSAHLCIRKDEPVGHILGSGFSWSEAVDVAADIYNGVSSTFVKNFSRSYTDKLGSSSSGRC